MSEWPSVCNLFITALNRARIKHLKGNQTTAPPDRLDALEAALTNLNKGQGLGLVLGGKVVDLSTLKELGSAIVSGAITVSALLLGLAEQHIAPVAGTCVVSAELRAAIRADVALLGGSATGCNYNVTLGELIAGQFNN